MRKTELLSLKKENFIYRKVLFFNIPKQVYIKSPKTKKVRIILLDFKIAIYMASYLKNFNTEDYIFTLNNYYISNNFHKVFKTQKNKNKIKAIRFADIRHIHASYLLANNKNKANCIKIVQERLGHSNIQQTFNTYTHVLQADAKKRN